MKQQVRSILITGILALFASSSMVAQTSNSSFEQWYRAKYGRPSPTEQARMDTQALNAVSPQVTPSRVVVSANAGFEQWYRAKYGRPSATEEARLQSAQIDVAALKTTQSTVALSTPGGSQFIEKASLARTALLGKSQLDSLIATARTPAQHEAIAKDYRDQAQDYLAQSKEHSQMGEQFRKNTATNNNKVVFGTVNHCDYLAVKFNDLAAKSQELAKQHEQMATDAGMQR